MDSTLLYKTQQTNDSTRFYNQNNSNISLERSVPFRQGNVIPQQIPPTIIPSRIVTQPLVQVPQNQTVVYCPVCRRDFFSVQIDQHAQLH